MRVIAAGKVGSSKSLGLGVSSQTDDACSRDPSALGRTSLRHQMTNQPRRLHAPVLGLFLMQTFLFDHSERRLKGGFLEAGMCGSVPFGIIRRTCRLLCSQPTDRAGGSSHIPVCLLRPTNFERPTNLEQCSLRSQPPCNFHYAKVATPLVSFGSG